MSDILSTIEKTLAEASNPDLKKKGKKNKKQNKQAKRNELRNFDDVDSFQNFIKMESLADYDEAVHAHLSYIPPFVMQSCHNDPEKIKPSMNKNNKKFVRHLNQHINKHLIKDMKSNCSFGDEIDLSQLDEEDSFDKLVWHYKDSHEHLTDTGHKFLIEMDVECHNADANVEIDYRSVLLE